MKRREFVKAAAVTPILAGVLGVARAAAAIRPSQGERAGFTFYSPVAEAWYRGGRFLEWTSTIRNDNGRRVKIFYRTFGDRSRPAIVILPGFPNSSFDYRELISLLERDYFVAVLDFPGFGFSDKPADGYSYMLNDDARLTDHFIGKVLALSRFSLYTHSRGVSVGLAFLTHFLDSERRQYEIAYHFISNSGMYLPLASLSEQQTAMLDPVRGPALIEQLRATPRVTEGRPEQVAAADIEAFNDGTGARLNVGKYHLERAANEERWLANLAKSPVPTALLWGLRETVNPFRIADYIWMKYLNDRDVESSFWLLPAAAHPPHRDLPEEVSRIVRLCLEGRIPAPEAEDAFMTNLARNTRPTSPIYVGHSRVRAVSFPGAVVYTPDGYRVP